MIFRTAGWRGTKQKRRFPKVMLFENSQVNEPHGWCTLTERRISRQAIRKRKFSNGFTSERFYENE